MAYQNINQYNFRRFGLKPVNEITDICLASDEKSYDQEDNYHLQKGNSCKENNGTETFMSKELPKDRLERPALSGRG